MGESVMRYMRLYVHYTRRRGYEKLHNLARESELG